MLENLDFTDSLKSVIERESTSLRLHVEEVASKDRISGSTARSIVRIASVGRPSSTVVVLEAIRCRE